MLRLVGLSHYRGTRPGAEGIWVRGEAREVPPETAAYLIASFPGVFVPVEEPEIVAPKVRAPVRR